jgi:hypothetical protein
MDLPDGFRSRRTCSGKHNLSTEGCPVSSQEPRLHPKILLSIRLTPIRSDHRLPLESAVGSISTPSTKAGWLRSKLLIINIHPKQLPTDKVYPHTAPLVSMMGRRGPSPNGHKLTDFINKLSVHCGDISPTTSFPTGNDSSEFDRPATWATTCGPEDEGFHEEWPPFTPKDLHKLMSLEQASGIVSRAQNYHANNTSVPQGVALVFSYQRHCRA